MPKVREEREKTRKTAALLRELGEESADRAGVGAVKAADVVI